MSSHTLKIGIVPPTDICNRAIEQSRNIGARFALDHKAWAPHVSLYTSEFPHKEDVLLQLARLAQTTQPFLLSAVSCELWEDVWLAVQYEKDAAIMRLQRAVVEQFNPLRKGLLRDKDNARLDALSEQDRQSVLRIGDRRADERFTPHLTLAKFAPGEGKEAGIPVAEFSFVVSELGVYEVGTEEGELTLLECFPLSS